MSVWTCKLEEILKGEFDCLKPNIVNYGNVLQKKWRKNYNKSALSYEYILLKYWKREVNILKDSL